MPLSSDYQHRSKIAHPQGVQVFGRTALKWYDLAETTVPISDSTRSKAQDSLTSFAAALTSDLAGFVILHQCSASFAFLLISTWRGNNELWQSVLYIDTPLSDFAPFPPAFPQAPALRPTFCVWELGIVNHEAQVWQRYLSSGRTDADLLTWRADCFTGAV